VLDAQTYVSYLWEVEGPGWEDPTRVHVGSGVIAVVDPTAGRVHLVTASGESRGSIGQQGGGPGEFLRLVDAFPYGDGFAVLDAGKSSIEYLDLDGSYVSSIHVQGQAWSGFPLAGGSLLVKGEFLSDPRQESSGDWVRVGEGSEPEAFTSAPLRPLPEEQGVQCSDFSPWAEGAARLRSTTPRIEVFDGNGGPVMESTVDLPVAVVSESERESALTELEKTLSARGLPPEFIEQNLTVQEERWRVKCRFGPLRFDPLGRLAAFLEQNPDDFGSGNAMLHLLSHDGVYLAKVVFPSGWRDFTLSAGVVYALTREPMTDLITLRAYRLDLPESVFSDVAELLQSARRRGSPRPE
jgi:hypothetical protein